MEYGHQTLEDLGFATLDRSLLIPGRFVARSDDGSWRVVEDHQKYDGVVLDQPGSGVRFDLPRSDDDFMSLTKEFREWHERSLARPNRRSIDSTVLEFGTNRTRVGRPSLDRILDLIDTLTDLLIIFRAKPRAEDSGFLFEGEPPWEWTPPSRAHERASAATSAARSWRGRSRQTILQCLGSCHNSERIHLARQSIASESSRSDGGNHVQRGPIWLFCNMLIARKRNRSVTESPTTRVKV